MPRKANSLLLLLLCFTAIPCFAAQNNNVDPYETYNRHAFAMNETLDKVVYKPVATIYKTAMPDFAEPHVTNFFNNIGTVPVIANDLLQFKIYQGTQDLWRLFFNSTFGILGLFDVASKIGLPDHDNDFGMTLDQWGYHNTNYFIIPFLGPSTSRDAMGLAVNYEILSVYPYIKNVRLRNSLVAVDFIQSRAQLLPLEDVMEQAAVDRYAFQRDAYLQRRAHLIAENRGEASNHAKDTDTYVDE